MAFRERFELDISDEDVKELNFVKPPKEQEMEYLHEQRKNLAAICQQGEPGLISQFPRLRIFSQKSIKDRVNANYQPRWCLLTYFQHY